MNTTNQPESNGAPNCWQCRYFAVSWDPSKPYSCRLMGFKSRITPSLEVLRADGRPCMGFVAKITPVNASATKANGTLA